MSQIVRKTHLEYYREHQIAPVHYDLTNMKAHMDRRCSLYTKLGLLPLTFHQARVLSQRAALTGVRRDCHYPPRKYSAAVKAAG